MMVDSNMLKPNLDDLQTLQLFLVTPTPKAWLEFAVQHIPLLLIDHAHCERKAAATAIHFISKYPEKPEIVAKMSPLAREELLHFEKVLGFIQQRKLTYGPLPPSRYAQTLHQKITKKGCTARLCDQLIVAAIIEARSCERFHALSEMIEDKILTKFYRSLVQAEARHFHDYLALAKYYQQNLDTRLKEFIDLENELITSVDGVFRFHSGIPLLEGSASYSPILNLGEQEAV